MARLLKLAVVAGLAAVIAVNVPDIKRYLKLRSM
jgi:hypothetical protein